MATMQHCHFAIPMQEMKVLYAGIAFKTINGIASYKILALILNNWHRKGA
jgi:hypothetical protein